MPGFRSWKYWLYLAIGVSIIALTLLSCQTKEPGTQSKTMSTEVRLLNRVGRAINRYRNSMDLAGYVQSAVERSLAERHCQINRDILELEFARVKLEIEEIAAHEGENKRNQAGWKSEVEPQSERGTDEAVKIREAIEKAAQEVAQAEQRQKKARSAQEMKQAQEALARAQRASEIAAKKRTGHPFGLPNAKAANGNPHHQCARPGIGSLCLRANTNTSMAVFCGTVPHAFWCAPGDA
jgi:hypothetical protein